MIIKFMEEKEVLARLNNMEFFSKDTFEMKPNVKPPSRWLNMESSTYPEEESICMELKDIRDFVQRFNGDVKAARDFHQETSMFDLLEDLLLKREPQVPHAGYTSNFDLWLKIWGQI